MDNSQPKIYALYCQSKQLLDALIDEITWYVNYPDYSEIVEALKRQRIQYEIRLLRIKSGLINSPD